MMKEIFFIDLHVHSVYSSDGKASLLELFKQARKIGLNGFALTDHNEIRGIEKARKVGKDFPEVLFVPGVEVTTAEGHILALNVEEVIPTFLPISETVEKIHALGGIAVAAHPYRLWSGIGEKAVLENIEIFDAIEVFNARNLFAGNRKSQELAKKTGKAETGGSDCHIVRELAAGYTLFKNPLSSAEDVVEEILKGRSRAGNGKFGRVTKAQIFIQGTHCVGSWVKRGFKDI